MFGIAKSLKPAARNRGQTMGNASVVDGSGPPSPSVNRSNSFPLGPMARAAADTSALRSPSPRAPMQFEQLPTEIKALILKLATEVANASFNSRFTPMQVNREFSILLRQQRNHEWVLRLAPSVTHPSQLEAVLSHPIWAEANVEGKSFPLELTALIREGLRLAGPSPAETLRARPSRPFPYRRLRTFLVDLAADEPVSYPLILAGAVGSWAGTAILSEQGRHGTAVVPGLWGTVCTWFSVVRVYAARESLGDLFRELRQDRFRAEVLHRSDLGEGGERRIAMRGVTGKLIKAIMPQIDAAPLPARAQPLIELLHLDLHPDDKIKVLGMVELLMRRSPQAALIEAFLRKSAPGTLSKETLDSTFQLLTDVLTRSGSPPSDDACARALGALAVHVASWGPADLEPLLEELFGAPGRRGLLDRLAVDHLLAALAPVKMLLLRSSPDPQRDARFEGALEELERSVPSSMAKRWLLDETTDSRTPLTERLNGMIRRSTSTTYVRDLEDPRLGDNTLRASDWKQMLNLADLVLSRRGSVQLEHGLISGTPTIERDASLQLFLRRAAESLNADVFSRDHAQAAIDLLELSMGVDTMYADAIAAPLCRLMNARMPESDVRRLFDALCRRIEAPDVYNQRELIQEIEETLQKRVMEDAHEVTHEHTPYFARRLDEMVKRFPMQIDTDEELLRSQPLSNFWQQRRDLPPPPDPQRACVNDSFV